MQPTKLSIVIPAYNEERRITNTLYDINTSLTNQTFEYEIIVVNDGSKDGTAAVIKDLQKSIPKLSLIDNKENHGKGYVVRQGMLAATGDVRLFMDADNSTTIQELFKLLPFLEQGQDIVIGSRYITGSHIVISQPLFRRVGGKVFRFIAHTLIPVGVTDLVCGFKLFTAEAAKKVFQQQTVCGWTFDIEILALARRNGLKVKEVPIVWTDDVKSDVTAMGMFKSLLEIIRLRITLWQH